MDETGHPGADAPAGGNGAGERDGSHDSTPWPANGSSSLEALAGWRQPGDRSGQGANGNGRGGGSTGRAAVGSARVGDNTSIRARAEMRAPYADLIAPLPPPAAVVNGDDPTGAGQPAADG